MTSWSWRLACCVRMRVRPIVGQNNPDGIELQEGKDTVPFTPHSTVKDILGTVCFLIP